MKKWIEKLRAKNDQDSTFLGWLLNEPPFNWIFLFIVTFYGMLISLLAFLSKYLSPEKGWSSLNKFIEFINDDIDLLAVIVNLIVLVYIFIRPYYPDPRKTSSFTANHGSISSQILCNANDCLDFLSSRWGRM